MYLACRVLLDTLQTISETIFPADHLTGAVQKVFPTIIWQILHKYLTATKS